MKKTKSFIKKSVLLILTVVFMFVNSAIATEEAYGECNSWLPATYDCDEVELFSGNGIFEQRLTDAWDSLADTVYVADLGITTSNVGDLYLKCLYENPMYYYVSSGVGYYHVGSRVTSLVIQYNETDRAVIRKTVSEMEAAADEILMVIDEDMTEFEKVMAVHDYMVLNYHYDTTYENYSMSILTTKTGVCMSYALAFGYVMDMLGIDNVFVSSEEINHAWNLVKVDGEWYHIDLTWDDPLNRHYVDNFASVKHTYALLSSERIQSMEEAHVGFDLGGISADSTLYDHAAWHSDRCAIATLGGFAYWVDGNKLVRQDGKVIYKSLNGKDNGWSIPGNKYYPGMVYTGIVAYDGLLYFNTETEILTYNPLTESVKTFFEIPNGGFTYGICLDGNTLCYSGYCPKNCGCDHYCEGGRIKLGDLTAKATTGKDGKLNVRMHKENDETLVVYTADASGCDMKKVTGRGYKSVSFDKKDEQTVFFWDENMKPLKPKKVITK